MANQNQRALPPDLARVRERLAAWRETKQPGARIPAPLWKMAVRLAGKYGVTRTARSLKLDYYALKKRVFLAEGQPAENGAAFVELPSVSAPAPACVIEWEDHAGMLRVHLTGYEAADIAVVGRSLRGSN